MLTELYQGRVHIRATAVLSHLEQGLLHKTNQELSFVNPLSDCFFPKDRPSIANMQQYTFSSHTPQHAHVHSSGHFCDML